MAYVLPKDPAPMSSRLPISMQVAAIGFPSDGFPNVIPKTRSEGGTGKGEARGWGLMTKDFFERAEACSIGRIRSFNQIQSYCLDYSA